MGINRRQFLKGLVGLGAALPLLEYNVGRLLADSPDVLTASGFPRRFISFYHPNGTKLEHWRPTLGPSGSERDFEFNTILEPLAPFREQLLVLDGITMTTGAAGPGGPHQKGVGTVLTGQLLQEGTFVGGDGSLAGWADGPSIDQIIANHISATTRLRSLELGVRADAGAGSEVRSRLNYTAAASPLPPQNDPRVVFNQLFADLGDISEDSLKRKALRQSVLDGVGGHFTGLRERLGRADRERLDAHQSFVRDLELRLENDPVLAGGCSQLLRPGELEADSEDTMPVIARTQIDLLVMAMACDLTRVGTIQLSNAVNHIRFPWVNALSDGHTLSHLGPTNTTAVDEWVKRDVWVAEQVAYLLGQLAAIPEGDGTMLDNTVVFWCNEVAVGNTHQHNDMPFLLAGGGGGVLDTGRYVRYDNQPHNNLLAAFANIYGIETNTFGHPDHCSGVLAGLV